MKIPIKKTHIRRGQQDHPNLCAIALGIKEFLGIDNVKVNRRDVKIGKRTLLLPDDAQDFVHDFDINKSSVQPFTLEL